MTEEDVRNYEKEQQEETNIKVHAGLRREASQESANDDDEFTLASEEMLLEDKASQPVSPGGAP